MCEVDDIKCERVARRRGQCKRVMTGTIAETSFRQTEVGVGSRSRGVNDEASYTSAQSHLPSG